MLSKLNKTKMFQLCFISFISSSNRCDNFIVNVFDNDSEQELDIQPQQPIATSIHTEMDLIAILASGALLPPTSLPTPTSIDMS